MSGKEKCQGIGMICLWIGIYLNWGTGMAAGRKASISDSNIGELAVHFFVNILNGFAFEPLMDLSQALKSNSGISGIHFSTMIIILGLLLWLISALTPEK